MPILEQIQQTTHATLLLFAPVAPKLHYNSQHIFGWMQFLSDKSGESAMFPWLIYNMSKSKFIYKC